MSQTETWRNVTLGTVAVLKFDKGGRESHEMVFGGRSFSLTKEERHLNIDRAATRELDVFSNGTLVPVRLLEGDEDAIEIASNPNLMGDDDMKSLFKAHWRNFEAKVNEIQNPIALNRMLDLAHEVDATVRQVRVIQERLGEVAPQNYREVDAHIISGSTEEGEFKPVTPK